MSMQHTPPKLKIPTLKKEVGPTGASGSSLTASQEDILRRKSEMEELKKAVSAETKTIMGELKKMKKEYKDDLRILREDFQVFKEQVKDDLSKEIVLTVKTMLDEWKTQADAALQQHVDEVNRKFELMESNVDDKLDNKLEPILQSLEQQQEAINELSNIAGTNVKANEKLLSENKRLSDLLHKITEKCIDLEGRQRRQNLRIVGLSEGKEGNQDPRKFAANLLKTVLNLDQEPLLGRAHRALRRRPQKGAPPRQLIVKVVYDHVLEDMMKIIIHKRNLIYDGDKISIFRDYPAEVAKRRALFTETRGILKKIEGLRYGLMYPATLRVTYDNKEHHFIKHTEALEFARNIEKKEEEEEEEGEADAGED